MKRYFVLVSFALAFLFVSCDNTLFIEATKLYKVSFETNGGTAVDSYHADCIEKFPVTEKAGYTFDGWYCDALLTVKVLSFPFKIDGNTTLYAKWKRNYRVTFETNGGTAVNGTNSVETCLLESPPITMRDGFEVSGWYTNAGFSGSPVSFPYQVTSPVTLYAKWIPVFAVTFVTNGGTVIFPKKTTALKVSPVSERAGFTLVAWYSDEELTEIVSFPLELSQSMTLYARWERNYTVTFESNGGTGFETLHTWCIERRPEPIKTGLSFGGWYTSPDFAPSTKVSFPFYPSKNTTLYARWNHYDYIVTYELNGGYNHSENPDGFDKGNNAIQLHEPGRTGCQFLGWYDNANFSGNAVAEIPENANEDKTYYAKWKLIVYSIEYVLNGGTNDARNSTSYTVETESFQLNSPAKTGYTFGGWYEKADFSGRNCTEIEKGSVGNKKLHAKWTPTEYAISYNLNGGKNNGANPTAYTIETATCTLSDASRNGYSFGGWYENAACTGERVTQIAKGSYGAKALYAKWELITYSIDYVLNGGTLEKANPTSYTVETETFELIPPVFEDNNYGEWHENANFSDEPVTRIKKGSYGNKVLYALKQSRNAELSSLFFYGNSVTVYDNVNDRNEITANVNTHEYYIEYQAIGASANVDASFTIIAIPKSAKAKVTLSNNSSNLQIKAFDSTQQDITLSVTAEDGKTVNTYLLHTVRVFTYADACKALTGRSGEMLVKVVDVPENVKLTRTYKKVTEYQGNNLLEYVVLTDTELSSAIKSKESLVSLDFSSVGLAHLGSYAFYTCTFLASVILPKSLEYIDEYAFQGTTVTSLCIPDGVTRIGKYAIASTNLNSIVLPSSVTQIDDYAFNGNQFSNIVLPSSLESIGKGAFQYCKRLATLKIPASLVRMEPDVFKGCENLKTVVFEDSSSKWFCSAYGYYSPNFSTYVGDSMKNAELLVKEKNNWYWYKDGYSTR